MPHARLTKRWHALLFHRVREAIVAGVIWFHHIRGITNPADILSKHWGYAQVWKTLQPVLFWEGDTADLIGRDVKFDASTEDGSTSVQG